MGKDLERSRDKAGTDGAAFTSAKAKVHSLAYKIDRVRERSKGGKADQRADVNMTDAVAGRERAEAKRLQNILE